MFERHSGDGWLSTGLLIYALIYVILIRKQKNKLSFSLLFWYCAILIDLTQFPIPVSASALEHIATKHTFRISTTLFEHTSKFQNVLNFIMFMPLGILIANHFKKLKPIHVIGLILLTTIGIELIQLITSYFSLNTRIFDVDDLLFNSLGGISAYLVYLKIKRT